MRLASVGFLASNMASSIARARVWWVLAMLMKMKQVRDIFVVVVVEVVVAGVAQGHQGRDPREKEMKLSGFLAAMTLPRAQMRGPSSWCTWQFELFWASHSSRRSLLSLASFLAV